MRLLSSYFFQAITTAIGTPYAIYLSAIRKVNVNFYNAVRLRLPDIMRHPKKTITSACDTGYTPCSQSTPITSVAKEPPGPDELHK